MTLLELKQALDRYAVILTLKEDGRTIQATGPRKVLTPDFTRWIQVYKPALLDALHQSSAGPAFTE